MIALPALAGVWRRSLLVAGGMRDVATRVVWLQGASWFADLRQPADLPVVSHARRLDDLTAADCLALARQQGFAGVLEADGDAFTWQRVIDFQPPGALPDRGRLQWQGDVLVETGVLADYTEHWHREGGAAAPVMAAASPNARLVRAGQQFMFARDRRVALPPGESLTAAARGLDLPALRALINCEISFGETEPGGWIITRSSLPWRVGATLKLRRLDFVEGDKAAPPPNPD
jgi:hypothetical protein